MTDPLPTQRDWTAFDYKASAGLYEGRGRHRSSGLGYKRFNSAAEAIRFAIEEMNPTQTAGAVLEVDEERFDLKDITRLYEQDAYPLERHSEADRVAHAAKGAAEAAPFRRMTSGPIRVRK
jgi:hypothetical protein